LAVGQLKFKDMSNLSTLPKGDSAWLLRKAIQRVMQQVSVLETNIGASTTGNSANSQVIFNDDGTLRGDPDLIFNTALNKLVAANLEATLALTVGTSATITGDLTVDTSTLKVDSANNRVGVKTATPAAPLHVASGNIRVDDGYQLEFGGSANSVAGSNATNTVQIYTNNVERYRIDSTGISTWSVAGTTAMTLNSTGLGLGGVPSGVNRFAVWNGATQAMTLDTSGNLLVGKTAASVTTVGFQTLPSGEASVAMVATTGAATTLNVYSTGAAAYRFFVGMNGTISATNTTISAISDARFKENVQDIDVGLGAILALKPRKFDWKAGKGKDIKGDRGFIAQEFEQVFPQLVDEWKDPAPEGEAPYKSVRQDLIPVLVKAIQELTARVQTLEAK
jgi:hypothetical protein